MKMGFTAAVLGLALTASGAALAQNAQTAPRDTDRTTAAPARSSDQVAPIAGANSFTEREARERIVKSGYADVGDLKKDDKGIWRGTAMKNGQRIGVALDFKGNVVPQNLSAQTPADSRPTAPADRSTTRPAIR